MKIKMKKTLLFLILAISPVLLLKAQPAKIYDSLLKEKASAQIYGILNASSCLEGFYAEDLATGDSFSWNADLSFPQASCIKIPILMEIVKQSYLRKFSLSRQLPVLPENKVGGSGVLQSFEDSFSLPVSALMTLMINESDNTATNTLIDWIGGVDKVTRTMFDLGFTHTMLRRKMMDSKAVYLGLENVSTPREAASIMKLLLRGDFLSKQASSKVLDFLRKDPRENSRLAKYIPSTVPIAYKPGELSRASTEWAVIFLQDHPYIIVMMENFKQPKDTSEVMEKISSTVFQYYNDRLAATHWGGY